MSKETEPILSRRELREKLAQEAKGGTRPAVPGSAEQAAAPAKPVAAAAVPEKTAAAAPAAKGERESQTRARDRAALRAYKDLIDPPAMNPLPSRRALRQAQLDAERAPITALNPVISMAAVQRPSPQRPATPPARPDATAKPVRPDAAKAARPAAAAKPVPVKTAPDAAPPSGAAPTATAPTPASPAAASPAAARQSGHQQAARIRSGRRAATARPSAQGTPQDPAATPSSAAEPDPSPAATAIPVIKPSPATGRSASPAVPKGDAGPSAGGADLNENYPPMPGLVPGGSYYPVSAGPPAGATPSAEDLQVLAAQKAEAERAAVLNQRAQARERLAQESAKSKRQAADPTATDNLAMVTPLEFIEVPGSSRPVMRPPATTHVPITTRATPHQPAARPVPPRPRPAPAKPETGRSAATPAADVPGPTVPSVSAERFEAALAARAVHRPGPGNRPLTGGRSSTLKKAEAMAGGGHPAVGADVGHSQVQRSQMPPMPADYAHGLEPLDAVTAGLGRTQRNLIIQWGSVLVGAIALVVAAIMIFTT